MRALVLLLAAGLAACASAPATAPRETSRTEPPYDAARDDPPRDAAHPARNVQVLVPSGGVGMNALLMLAAGQGRKPTVLLLHGLPGNEQNLDLAQAIRRAGWNVLTLHYRGSWGSPGSFSIAHAVEDASAATAFLRTPAVADKFGVDPDRLVIAGHSMGGFAAAQHAARHDDVDGVILLDAWNVAATGAEFRANSAMLATPEAIFDDLGNSLAGADPASLAREVVESTASWDLLALARGLARQPVLVVWADDGIAAQNTALAAAIEQAGAKNLTTAHFPTDHAFVDYRIALAQAVVAWLATLTPGTAR